MDAKDFIRKLIKAARARGSFTIRLLDLVRLIPTADGRARLWTRFAHGARLHQTSSDTCEDRYPELFHLAAQLEPDPKRILSFGCSTGEELVSLRHIFPNAQIVGAEINQRSRRIAAHKTAADSRIEVVGPADVAGAFDLIFALAVFQREPIKIAEIGAKDLTPYYPFHRFDAGVTQLASHLSANGLLCVMHAHYRIEDSSAAAELDLVAQAPPTNGLLFGRDGIRLSGVSAGMIFRKLSNADRHTHRPRDGRAGQHPD